MISYISQSYEDVLEMKTEDTFRDMCHFNQEYQVFLKFINYLRRKSNQLKFNCFLLSSDFHTMKDEGDNHEHSGFAKKLKTSVDEQSKMFASQIKVLKEETQEANKQMMEHIRRIENNQLKFQVESQQKLDEKHDKMLKNIEAMFQACMNKS